MRNDLELVGPARRRCRTEDMVRDQGVAPESPFRGHPAAKRCGDGTR